MAAPAPTECWADLHVDESELEYVEQQRHVEVLQVWGTVVLGVPAAEQESVPAVPDAVFHVEQAEESGGWAGGVGVE